MRLTARRIARGLWWLLAGRPDQRRRVRHELAGRAARLFGDFPIGDDHKLWRRDEEFLADFKRLVPDYPYTEERKYLLRELARYTRDLPGCLAECGVFEGASAYFLARARPDAVVHLFDRFEGLPLPGPEDAVGDREVSRWQPGDFRARLDVLSRNLAGLNNVRVHRGDIPEVLRCVSEERFCLVHIDVDLYRPTLESLRFFYPRMVPGGVIVLDDYGFATCPGVHRAVQEFMEDKPEYVVHAPTGQGIIFRRPR
jgi:predicted O-methyltransferase YrrM